MAPLSPGGARIPFRTRLGTPIVGDAPKLMLLGSGELGREVAIEAIRLGAEVIAVDRYPNAPAMHVAQRHEVIDMTSGSALRALVERMHPDVIVPEIEQIDTEELVRLEDDGWAVVPNAQATRATMNRERIRRLAAEQVGVPTSRYGYAESAEEARESAGRIGFPCVFKAITSSSGHGMTIVRSASGVSAAYREASRSGRVANARVMIEEFIPFDQELTVLTLRHYSAKGRPKTTTMSPIGHERPGTLYHESWQPAALPTATRSQLDRIAERVTSALGGLGMYGVECFIRGSRVYFSEVSPRPHDTGLVTLASQWNSEFALHARAVLGLPYEGPEPVEPAAAHVILGRGSGPAPSYGGVAGALGRRGVRIYLFGKPDSYPERRLGVAVARAATTSQARRLAKSAAHGVEAQLVPGISRHSVHRRS